MRTSSLPLIVLLLATLPACEQPASGAPAGGSADAWASAGSSDEPTTDPVCAPVAALTCGDLVSGDTADWNSGATDVIDHYPAAVGSFSGPEITWSFVAPASGPVTFALVDPSPTQVDHDLFALEDDAGSCNPEATLTRGHNGLQFEAVESVTYYLVIDGYDGDAGPFSAEIECAAPEEPTEPEPVCDAYDSDETESAPIQVAGAGLPGGAAGLAWTSPADWTSWIAFSGSPGVPATHEGIDYVHDDPAAEAVDVLAAAAGTVAYVRMGCPQSSVFEHNEVLRECGSGWGNHVVVDHGGGLYTRYAHLNPDDVAVRVGDHVEQGDVLGGMGNSGRSETRHLHLELGTAGEAFDPCAPARSFDRVWDPAGVGLAG